MLLCPNDGTREECLWGGGRARAEKKKAGAPAKSVKGILPVLADALITPSQGTQSDSCHLAPHTWTCSMSPSSRSSQHEILEDYAEGFGLLGWL